MYELPPMPERDQRLVELCDSVSESFLDDMLAEAIRLLMRNQQLADLCDSIEPKEGEDVLR